MEQMHIVDEHFRSDIVDNPESFIKSLLSSRFAFGVDEVTRHGKYKYMGWAYDLRPLLKRFVYKQHGQWSEIYALNKTNLRKLVYGVVDEIAELPND